MVYIGILWNTVNDFKTKILQDIGDHASIINFFEINLEDRYEQFVRDIYLFDGIAEWKVDLKLKAMQESNNRNIIIMFLQIDDKEKIFNEKKNKQVIVNVENLKNTIRSKYSLLIPNYFFDNVFHMTDNEEEVLSTLSVLEKWFPDIYTIYQDCSKNYEIGLRRIRTKNENK